MALVVADRVQETTTTSGTGTFSLAGAVAGFKTFVSGIGTTNTTYYAAYDQTAQVWEVGLGTVTSGSPDTLSRDTILSNSSGTTAKISFAGNTTYVWCDYPAGKVVIKDASGFVGINATPVVQFQIGSGQEVLDVGAAFNTSKFNSQGTAWSSASALPSIVFNAAATDRPEVSWIRGTRTYPEFAIRQHTTADTGGQFWAGAGTAAPSLVYSVTSSSQTWTVSGSDVMYLAGTSLGMGSSPAVDRGIQTSRSASGATTCYGIVSGEAVQSGVTSGYSGFLSAPATAAAAFTLSNLRHYYANGVSVGSGSAVTNQYGFFVESNLTGATNNYGFYSNIASGTGRYNFYANGSADNYFAGNVGIGTTGAEGNLHVFSTSAGTVTANINGNLGVFEAGGSNGLSILVPDASTSIIMFGSPTSNRGAEVNWSYNSSTMQVGTRKAGGTLNLMSGNATVGATLDSSGNLQVLGGLVMPGQGAPTSKSANATLTGAELITGLLTATGAGGITVNFPTAANIEAALTWGSTNTCIDFYVVNTSGGNVTMGVNGNTQVGTTFVVASSVSAQFRVRRTAASTFTIYRLG